MVRTAQILFNCLHQNNGKTIAMSMIKYSPQTDISLYNALLFPARNDHYINIKKGFRIFHWL